MAYNHNIPLGLSEAEALNITRQEIEQIVNSFYGKVQQDPVLGPIFEESMEESWDNHLVKMSNFWTAVMFGVPVYKGNPLQAHLHVKGISPEHFQRWLDLFKLTLEEVCPSAEHVDAFLRRASNMARVMIGAIGQVHFFGVAQ